MPVREVPARFSVAFSLAGEQRQLVLPIAQEVEAALGWSTVFYDDWYEHWIAGIDADLLLQKLYGEGAELVIVCVSGAYDNRPWTRVEHRAVRTRLMNAKAPTDRHQIFPIRVGDGDVEGILLNEIVSDFRHKAAAEAAELIVARLNLVRSHDNDMKPGSHWPKDVPVLSWPMADHTGTCESFAKLLSSEARQRALLVSGAPETGKSYMSKHMVRNAMQILGVAAARFDFKGSINMDVEIEAFSRLFDIEPPTGRGVSEQLAMIFSELRRRAKPTLLVFDTYEAAGEAKKWIEGVLLPYLTYAHWLRVVVIGQSVPARGEALWESIAAEPITLELPGPEDWLAYGQANRGESVKIDFVAQAHEFASGKPSLLAGLLGPRL